MNIKRLHCRLMGHAWSRFKRAPYTASMSYGKRKCKRCGEVQTTPATLDKVKAKPAPVVPANPIMRGFEE